MKDLHIVWRLTRLTFRYPWIWILALVSTVGASAMSVIPNEAIRFAIDRGLTGDGGNQVLLGAGAVILAAALVRGLLAYGQQFFGQTLSQRIAYDIRNALYNQIQRLSSAFHDRAQTGQLMSRATQDVEQSRNFAEGGLIRAVNILALVGIALFRIITFSSKLTLIVLPFLVFLAWRAIVFQTRQRPLMLQTQQKIGELTVILQEALSGIRVVKAFSQEEQERTKFHKPAEEVYERQVAAQSLQAVNSPMMTIAIYFAMLAVLIFGAFEVRAERLTIGQLSAFTLYLQLLAQPVRQLGFIVTMYSRASAAGERIFEILDTESTVQDKPDSVDIGRLQGSVTFDAVSFGYDAISPVLRDVSFSAASGEVIALLGPTGSGKTTVVSLLPRFYDVTAGSIKIDGFDLRDMKLASLRRNIGMVLQDPFLFTGTIRDNILYSKPDATEEEVIAAAKAARIHDFIMSLPEEYDTWVGERGITLSGGQKQRVSIARTLLLDPAILILDDATSSVDMETEYLIQQALSEVMKGRTSFIIAQRLRTIKHANQILVLRDGVLEQQGSHEQLLSDPGYYREIYELQLRGQEDEVEMEETRNVDLPGTTAPN